MTGPNGTGWFAPDSEIGKFAMLPKVASSSTINATIRRYRGDCLVDDGSFSVMYLYAHSVIKRMCTAQRRFSALQ